MEKVLPSMQEIFIMLNMALVLEEPEMPTRYQPKINKLKHFH